VLRQLALRQLAQDKPDRPVRGNSTPAPDSKRAPNTADKPGTRHRRRCLPANRRHRDRDNSGDTAHRPAPERSPTTALPNKPVPAICLSWVASFPERACCTARGAVHPPCLSQRARQKLASGSQRSDGHHFCVFRAALGPFGTCPQGVVESTAACIERDSQQCRRARLLLAAGVDRGSSILERTIVGQEQLSREDGPVIGAGSDWNRRCAVDGQRGPPGARLPTPAASIPLRPPQAAWRTTSSTVV
jgi:hypothetical protein